MPGNSAHPTRRTGQLVSLLPAVIATGFAVAVLWARLSGYWETVTYDAVLSRLGDLLFVAGALAIGSLVITGIIFLSYRVHGWFEEEAPRPTPQGTPPARAPGTPLPPPPPVPGVAPDVVEHFMKVAEQDEAEAVAEEAAKAAEAGRLVPVEAKLFDEVVWKPGMSEQESSQRTRAAMKRHLASKKKDGGGDA